MSLCSIEVIGTVGVKVLSCFSYPNSMLTILVQERSDLTNTPACQRDPHAPGSPVTGIFARTIGKISYAMSLYNPYLSFDSIIGPLHDIREAPRPSALFVFISQACSSNVILFPAITSKNLLCSFPSLTLLLGHKQTFGSRLPSSSSIFAPKFHQPIVSSTSATLFLAATG